MREKILAVVFVLFITILISGCIQRQAIGPGPEATTGSIGAVIFTNQSVNTQADAENLFSTYKQDLWDFQNIRQQLGFPIFDAISVYPFDPNSPEASETFSGNFGTIKFTMELPISTVGQFPDWKVENGIVVIRGCKTNLVQVDNQTPVCSSADTVWTPAAVLKYWVNDKGVIFARGAGFITFEPYFKVNDFKEARPLITLGKETNITFGMKSNVDVPQYKLTLSLPPELELVSGKKINNVDLEVGKTIELTWTIKGLQVGNYELKLQGQNLNAVVEVRVEQPPVGVGIGTN